MARMIDANEVDYENISCSQSQLHWLHRIIEMQPTVDAVEVVRCKDCKYWGQDVCSYTGDDESFCTNPDGLDNYAHPDDFCSYGERRTDG